MGLFAEIYNTVAKFFSSQDDTTDDSKFVAKNRLKLVLMQDRTNLTPKILEQMRGELVDLLSKYLEMDKDMLELNFEHEGNQVALMLSIPVIRARDEEEIEAALQAEKEVTDDSDEEFEDEDDNDSYEEDNDEYDNEDLECEVESEVNEEEIENSDTADNKQPKRKKKRNIKKDIAEEENLETDAIDENTTIEENTRETSAVE